MHALLVSHRPALLPIDGGTLATHAVVTGLLSTGCHLRVLSIETDRHPATASREQTSLAEATGFDTWRVDTRVTPTRALRGVFQESYNVQRFDHPDGRAKIESHLRSEPVDVVILDSLYTTPYLPVVRRHTSAPVVLRPQNVEHQIWRLRAAHATGARARYLRYLADQIERYERRVFNAVDGIAAISSADHAVIAAMAPATPAAVVEIGLAPSGEPAPIDPTGPLCSIAAYDWAPNVEGMRWFLDEVWPRILTLDPDTRLHLAGRHLDRYAAAFARPGVEVLGSVPSAAEFLLRRGIVVAPLLSGGGVRVKLVEAMLLGRPIVTTSVGAQGLAGTAGPGRPLVVSDEPEAFARAVVELRRDPDRADRLGATALQEASARYSVRAATSTLMDLIEQVRANTRT